MSPREQKNGGLNGFLSKLDRPIDKFNADRQSQTRKLTPRKIEDIRPMVNRVPHVQSQAVLSPQVPSVRSPSRVKELLQQPLYTFQKGVSYKCNENNNRDYNQFKTQSFSPKTAQQNRKLPQEVQDFYLEKTFDTDEKAYSQNRLSMERLERMSDISIIRRNTFFLHQEESYNCFKGDKMSSDLYNLFQSSHMNLNLTRTEAVIKIQRSFRRYYARKQIKLLRQQEQDVQNLESLLENYIKEVKNTSLAEGIMKLKNFVIKQVKKKSFLLIKTINHSQARSPLPLPPPSQKVEEPLQSRSMTPRAKMEEELLQMEIKHDNKSIEVCGENPFSQVYSILGQVNQIIRSIHYKEEEEKKEIEKQQTNQVHQHQHQLSLNGYMDSILSMDTKKNIKKTALKQFINAGLQKENVLKDHSNRQQTIIKPAPRKSRNSKDDFSFVNTQSEAGLSTVNSFNNRPLGSKENMDPAQGKIKVELHGKKNSLTGFDYRNSYEKIKEKYLACKCSGQTSFSPGRVPLMTPEFNSVINFSQ